MFEQNISNGCGFVGLYGNLAKESLGLSRFWRFWGYYGTHSWHRRNRNDDTEPWFRGLRFSSESGVRLCWCLAAFSSLVALSFVLPGGANMQVIRLLSDLPRSLISCYPYKGRSWIDGTEQGVFILHCDGNFGTVEKVCVWEHSSDFTPEMVNFTYLFQHQHHNWK